MTEQERQRIKAQQQARAGQPSIGVRIDNSQQTPEETAQQIIRLIQG